MFVASDMRPRPMRVAADAEDEAKNLADLVMTRAGGRGAVRQFTDLILKSSGLWSKVSGESFG